MKVINFYGGAAIGKSTIAADMYSKLKRMGYRTELVGEFAKWLWYQQATDIVEDQLYLFAEQAHRTRTLAKYGVDFAVKKDRSVSPPKYLIFFKGRDADALTAAFREYTAKEVKRASQDKPSVLEQLRALKAKVLSLTPDKARNKDKGLEL